MSDVSKLVCFVTPAPLADAARVAWQADALLAAGYRVHVVHGGDSITGHAARWPRTAVPNKPSALAKTRRALARRLLPFAPFANAEVALHVHDANSRTLVDSASAVDAHYYIGSRVAGIAAAALAAERTRAKFGVDVDAHCESGPHAESADPLLRSAARIILATFLPRAAHRTADTPEIAAAFATCYGIRPDIVPDVKADKDAAANAGRIVLLRLVKQAAGRP
jgi:hypothetical protein